jgi:hypothetical protein
VKLFNADTGECFANSEMQIQQLPESFESDTTLHLQDGDWQVVEARPMTAAGFRKSGELVLILRKVRIETIALDKVLYSLPTISMDQPGVIPGSTKLGKQVIEIHEDDWRQVEWIHASHSEAIDAELDAIRMIYENHRANVGFKKLHVRNAIPQRLAGHAVGLEPLASALSANGVWLEGVAYQGIAGILRDSFSMRLLSSLELYGIAPAGELAALCLHHPRMNNKPQPDVGILAGFVAEHRLVLVDWCRMQRIEPDPNQYFEYLTTRNTA